MARMQQNIFIEDPAFDTASERPLTGVDTNGCNGFGREAFS
jgi:hypothetical protein